MPEYLTTLKERRLIEAIDRRSWEGRGLRRRTQHYGFQYEYKTRCPRLLRAIPLPRWAREIGKRLVEDGLMDVAPAQLIVNEYLPGQGISPHVDREDLFGERIVSLSLGSAVVMSFLRKMTREKISLVLERRSALALSGEARHAWCHAIPLRKTDVIDGELRERHRRISLTFRTVLEGGRH